MFTWCTEVLHFSEDAAYARIKCARAARKFPLILERLADGSLHLTGARLLAPVLTRDNHRQLLDRARHQGKRQIEEIVAEIRPVPETPPSIRRTGSRGCALEATPLPMFDGGGPLAAADPVGGIVPGDAEVAGSPAEADGAIPVGSHPGNAPSGVGSPARPPHRYRFQFSADEEMHADFQMARELLRHQIPDGNAAKIMKLALRRLVQELRNRRFGEVARPRNRRDTRTATPGSGSRHIPASVRREVSRRDGYRCTYRAPDGRRCSATGQLEFHHHEPYALGGHATSDNISLRCRAHNQFEARVTYGDRATRASARTPETVRDQAAGGFHDGFRNLSAGPVTPPPPAPPPGTRTPGAGAGSRSSRRRRATRTSPRGSPRPCTLPRPTG
jgi:5-methylcytosine-specific restriction endonuclease McrA